MKQWKEELIKKVELKGNLALAKKVRKGLKRVKKLGITKENATSLISYFTWASDYEHFGNDGSAYVFWDRINKRVKED